jgi:hypothetical protein
MEKDEPIAREVVPAHVGVEDREGDEPIAPMLQAEAEEGAGLSGMVEGSPIIDAGRSPKQENQKAGGLRAQMKNDAESARYEYGNDKKDSDQISKSRKENHLLPCPRWRAAKLAVRKMLFNPNQTSKKTANTVTLP